MTEFVLVNPPLSAAARYGRLAGLGNQLPNLGLAYLAAALRERGVDVAIIDAAALQYDAATTVAQVIARKPRFCGLTAATLAVHAAATVAAAVKSALPECRTIIGGPHVSSLPLPTLAEFPAFDLGVVGEGESTAWELVQAVREGRDPGVVPGVIARLNGRIVAAPPREPLADLDALPLPAWDLLPDLASAYAPSPQSVFRLPSTILFTSRGCPYHCSFCDRSVFGNRLRLHSAGRVFAMMEHLYRAYGIVDFAFHDESLLIREDRLLELCRLLRESGLPLSFSCQGRVDQPVAPAVWRAMAAAGCWQVAFGIESGSDAVLATLCKGTTVAQGRARLREVRAAGLATKAFIMLGVPGETPRTLAETAAFVLHEALDDVMLDFFTPFPGSELSRDLERRGELLGDYRRMSEHEVTFVPRGLATEELLRFRRWLYRRFYLRPRIVGRYLRRLRHPSARVMLLRAAVAFLRSLVLER